MKRHYMLKICLLLMVAMPLVLHAKETELVSQQDCFAQETPTPDLVIDEETNEPKILNDSNTPKIDNTEKEHTVSDDILYNN